MRKFHHVGIPTTVPRSGEVYLERFKVYCTDHESNPYGIQWMRFEPDCSLPDLVKTVPHVAFEVDDLQAALEGHDVLIQPNSPSDGVLVAFIVEDGAPVEFIQFVRGSSQPEGVRSLVRKRRVESEDRARTRDGRAFVGYGGKPGSL